MPQAIEFDEDGEMAGYIVAEPFGTQAVNGGFAEEFLMSKDLWPEHPCCVVVASNKLIASNAAAVQELTNAMVKAGKFATENIDETVKIGAEFLSQTEDVVRKVLTEPVDRVLFNNLLPVKEDLAKIQDYMHDEMGLLGKKLDIDKFVNLDFAKSAGAS